MDAVASNDVDQLRSARSLVAPRSPAALYVDHQVNLARAEVEGGAPLDPEEVSGSGDEFELCVGGRRCVMFTDFERAKSGRLASFRVNGFDIAPRLSRGDGGAVRAAGAKFTFLTSYLHARRMRIASFAVRVESGAMPLLMNPSNMTYRDASGEEEIDLYFAGGSRTMDAHSSSLSYSGFIGVRQLGGTLTLDGCVDGCNRRYKIKIRT